MHPVETSVTRSSKSPTINLTPVQYLKGVGPHLAALFARHGIRSILDLLYFFPRTYEDRSQFVSIKDLEDGVQSTLMVEVMGHRWIQTSRFRIFEVRTSDSTGQLFIKFFRSYAGIERQFQVGRTIIVTGKAKTFKGQKEMTHPEMGALKTNNSLTNNLLDETQPKDKNYGRVVPIYTEIEGLSTKTLRNVLWNALKQYRNQLREDLPFEFLTRYRFPTLSEAILEIHFPKESQDSNRERSRERLIYEELFKFHLLLGIRKINSKNETPPIIKSEALEEFYIRSKKTLPFALTSDQESVIQEIIKDLKSDVPMNRLVHGDVGSGKTIVALMTMAGLFQQGKSSLLLAPTEVLAVQHFLNAQKFFESKTSWHLLTGKTSAKERQKITQLFEAQVPVALIGTHALIEDWVKPPSLALIVVDEQQRFGVEQRMLLKEKAAPLVPHTLLLSATPIPRTLALSFYGDLNCSPIKTMPAGRKATFTKVVQSGTTPSNDYLKMIDQINSEINAGKQAYIIYPLIDPSEAEGFEHLKSVTIEFEKLRTKIFPTLKMAMLHGRMSSDEKNALLSDFKSGKIHILVSTTVIEVGIDNPNATVMVVEQSERFGLSQLHQLRGRVGRGDAQSYCFYVTHPKLGSETLERLKVLEKTQDGFLIAEADLKIRGPGEFLGTRQSGAMPFKIANLVTDKDWLERAHADASTLLKADPFLLKPTSSSLNRFLKEAGAIQLKNLKTG